MAKTPRRAVAREPDPEDKVPETVPVQLQRLADSLRRPVDTAGRMADDVDGRLPFRVLDGGGLVPMGDLDFPDTDWRPEVWPVGVKDDVIAAVLEWRNYLALGVEEAQSCLIACGDLQGGEQLAAFEMKRVICRAHEHCGPRLRRLAAMVEAAARVKPTKTEPHAANSAGPDPQPILEFLPGLFLYKGQRFALTGKPWEFLREFSRARHHTLTADQLSSLWGKLEADGVENATVKQHVSAARKALRVAIQAVDSRRGKFDPIHNVGRGPKELAWRMELTAT